MTAAEAATGRAAKPKRAATILFLKGMQAFSPPPTIDDTPAGSHCMSHWLCESLRHVPLPLAGERNMSNLVPHPSTPVQITAIGRGVGEHDLEQLAEQLTDARIVRPA